MKTSNKMFFLLIFLFKFGYNYSQTYESVKKADTIYIYFNHKEFQEIKDADINRKKILKEVRNYEIKFDNQNIVTFSERKYLDFDSVQIGKEMEKRIEKKSFLKKNKEKIIDINFIKKYGLKEVYFLINTKSKYLIDTNETKCNRILLKEVTFGFVSYFATE